MSRHDRPRRETAGVPDAARAELGAWQVAAMALVLFATVLARQWLSDAFGAEFASDAAGHYVSALLMHDYLRAWPLKPPVAYLIDYHAHYPIVGLGTWPPLYYAISAAWMFLTGTTAQPAQLLLSGLVTTAAALLLATEAARRVPAGRLRIAWGLCAGLTFVFMPVVQEASGSLMLDVPVTLACIAAIIAYARFLDGGRLAPALLFGVFAAAGLLFKGSAGCLALVPPLALLLGRRLDLAMRAAFWASALVVILLAGPWFLATFHRSEAGFTLQIGPAYWSAALRFDLLAVYDACGPLLIGLAAIRLARICLPGRKPRQAIDVTAAALALSVIPFHLFVPVDLQPRYMLPMMAAIILLAFGEAAHLAGTVAATRRMVGGQGTGRPALILALLTMTVPVLVGAMHVPHPVRTGMLAAVGEAMQALPAGNPVILAIADPEGEAQAISGVARLDHDRPRVFVVRGTRLFGESAGGSGYLNSDYRPRFAQPEELLREIENYGIPIVVFRRSRFGPDWEHLEQFETLLRSHPNRWEQIGQTGAAELTTTIYRVRGNEDRKADESMLRRLSGPRALQ